MLLPTAAIEAAVGNGDTPADRLIVHSCVLGVKGGGGEVLLLASVDFTHSHLRSDTVLVVPA